MRERLRDGMEEALKTLANGLISHPRNAELRRQLQSLEITAEAFYQELLRLVYRLLFLMVAEERKLVSQHPVYLEHYSLSRLRRLAESRAAYNDQTDAWLGLQTTFELFRDEKLGAALGVTPLNGDLFSHDYTRHLDDTVRLSNREFFSALWHLSMYREQPRAPWRRINYAALDVEELGSVYESLLDYHPLLLPEAGGIRFDLSFGSERKTTGSYYTPPELVQELIRSALEPVIQDRLETAAKISDAKSKVKHQERALLSIKICDPASGSGHFLLAAARRLGRELAKVRAGEDEPGPETQRQAIREVIAHCIYAVDKNPLAVDLCKVALWIESHAPGKPLAFLDDRVRWGDSLIGVLDPAALKAGIPDEAFEPISGDDKALARSHKARNRAERQGQMGMAFEPEQPVADALKARQAVLSLPDDTPDQVRRKAEAYQKFHRQGGGWWQAQTLYHLWTAAFFQPYRDRNDVYITTDALRRYQRTHNLDGRLVGKAWELAFDPRHPFFHWTLEFPEVFAAGEVPERGAGSPSGGFDVVLCNPPWERIKLQEQEFFATKDAEIAGAPNAAARKRLIARLEKTNPALWRDYRKALRASEAQSQFLRHSQRYPLTGRGDINTYSVFAELFTQLVSPRGRVGVVIPTGIATDDTNKFFFADLVGKGQIHRLIGFENEALIFPDVHHAFKFCALTIGGERALCDKPDFAFFCRHFTDVNQQPRHFNLSREDIAKINPNTRTLPVFRTRQDADLTRAIYARVPVLVNERTDENPWGVRFLAMFHMSNDSHLFRTRQELERNGFRLEGNRFVRGEETYLTLYEAKMIWHYDHRFGSYEERGDERGFVALPEVTESQHQDPNYVVHPFYWVPSISVQERLNNWKHSWLLGFRDVTSAVVQRTAIFSLMPRVAVGGCNLILPGQDSVWISLLLAMANSIPFDFMCRQKISGVHLTIFSVKQLPVLPPSAYTPQHLHFIVPRVLELTYTAWDLKPFADDVWHDADPSTGSGQDLRAVIREQWEANRAETGGHKWVLPEWISAYPEIETDPQKGIPLPPFKWDEQRRAKIRAELDAYYARLYGLNRKQLRYILDPADLTPRELEDILDPWEEVSDPLDPRGYAERCAKSTFPGETFRVLKEKEIRQYGEYRTRRLVLEAWERLEARGELPAERGALQASNEGEVESERQEVLTIQPEKREDEPIAAPGVLPPPAGKQKAEETPIPPSLTDFGLYKCEVCGKMVMGFDRESHVHEAHRGKKVE